MRKNREMKSTTVFSLHWDSTVPDLVTIGQILLIYMRSIIYIIHSHVDTTYTYTYVDFKKSLHKKAQVGAAGECTI